MDANAPQVPESANPMDCFQLRGGIMHCEDVPLPELAASVGTPAYVYSAAAMNRQVEILRAALRHLGDPLIAYAVKANPNAAVIATFAGQGLGADVVSGGEYQRAIAAGVPADKIVFSGIGKTEEEMAIALRGGLFQFNLESVGSTPTSRPVLMPRFRQGQRQTSSESRSRTRWRPIEWLVLCPA
jgi:diaminopimelate decarboxylase